MAWAATGGGVAVPGARRPVREGASESACGHAGGADSGGCVGPGVSRGADHVYGRFGERGHLGRGAEGPEVAGPFGGPLRGLGRPVSYTHLRAHET